jgi:hypothetical protein
LTAVDLGFDVAITGFEIGEIDLILQEAAAEEKAEEEPVEISSGPAVTKPGDMWLLGDHRLICGDALEESTYSALMGGQKADVVFADPPYNVKIDGQPHRLRSALHPSALSSGKSHDHEWIHGSREPSGPLSHQCQILVPRPLPRLRFHWVHSGNEHGRAFRGSHDFRE